MHAVISIGEIELSVDLACGLSLARPLDFAARYSEFGVDPPACEPVKAGDFIGDTGQGGGCNVDRLSLIPHCHGTHTETVGHIVNEKITLADVGVAPWMIAALITVPPQSAESCGESYRPDPAKGDQIITASRLELAKRELLAQADAEIVKAFELQPRRALIVHCPVLDCEAGQLPPYFSCDAIRWCNDQQIEHLLVDFPSIDRTEDGGLLTNHHLYWNVPETTHSLTKETCVEKTITELISVDEQIRDAFYLLNLQVPQFCLDAAPSKPVIFPVGAEKGNV